LAAAWRDHWGDGDRVATQPGRRLRRDSGETTAGPACGRAGLSQGIADVIIIAKGPCPHNRFRTSLWQPGSCGVANGLGAHRALVRPEIPSRIPNQNFPILVCQRPFMKRLGVQASALICRDGAVNGTAHAKALTPNRFDAVANLPCTWRQPLRKRWTPMGVLLTLPTWHDRPVSDLEIA